MDDITEEFLAPDFRYQTRSEVNGLHYFNKIEDALIRAEADESIWKISFESRVGQRIRLVRNAEGFFQYESIFGD
jgi:hypothetical protein